MTRRTGWLFTGVAWGGALAYAIYQGGALAWHLLGFVLILSLLIALFQLGPLSRVTVDRHVRPGPYSHGESLTVTLTVRSERNWIWPYLLLVDHLPQGLEVSEPRFVLGRTGKRPITLTYRIPLLKRGVYRLREVSLTTGDLFGLFHRCRVIARPDSLVVWPATISLSRSHFTAELWHGENLAYHPTREESIHVRGIREYVPGDRLSHVHWKTSAHTGDFKVKQFEPETQPEFTIMLDYANRFTRDDWEVAIATAASLILQANQGRQAMGLIAMDTPDRIFLPSSGPTAITTMMDFLSELDYRSGSSTVSSSRRPSSKLLVITAVKYADMWRGHSEMVLAIGPGGVHTLSDLPRYLTPHPLNAGDLS